MITENEVYKVGTLTRVHALKGEVSFAFTDDVWDRVDADYLVLEVDGIMVPFFLEEYRFRSDSVALVKFQDIDSAEDAQELVGCSVYFPTSLTPDEEPDELQWSYFTGFMVQALPASAAVDAADEEISHEALASMSQELGRITHVDDKTANVLFYIEGASGELIVPAVEEFIVDVDRPQRVITMQLPDGLLDLNE